jgi:hypothetical protein
MKFEGSSKLGEDICTKEQNMPQINHINILEIPFNIPMID